MKMKRLFTLVLSLMMILSLSAPASAIDGENVYTKEEISSINEVNVATLTDMIIPEKTAGLLVCQNDEEEEKFLVNWSGTSLCCCFYDSHD